MHVYIITEVSFVVCSLCSKKTLADIPDDLLLHDATPVLQLTSIKGMQSNQSPHLYIHKLEFMSLDLEEESANLFRHGLNGDYAWC